MPSGFLFSSFFSLDTTKSKSRRIKVDNSSDGQREIKIRRQQK